MAQMLSEVMLPVRLRRIGERPRSVTGADSHAILARFFFWGGENIKGIGGGGSTIY